jgi:signal transducer and activator of transcription 5B
MEIQKIDRKKNKLPTVTVKDEKYAFYFKTTFKDGDLEFDVSALSLPVVVIVHGTQAPEAWATTTWHNAFAEIDHVPFVVPESVPLTHLVEVLNMKFESRTGRPLTQDNIHCLCEKMLNTSLSNPVPNINVSWTQCSKVLLTGRTFTFWQWFYDAMELTREHLRDPWIDLGIGGFIHKTTAEEIINNCARGTFLLRFSDSQLGGISIVCANGGNESVHIQPFTPKDLKIRSLSHQINDLDDLQMLYVNPELIIPKEDAFGINIAPPNNPTNIGYVFAEIRVQLVRPQVIQ